MCPGRINFEKLRLDEVIPLIDAKKVKEANRYIHKFEDEKLQSRNGR